ncbi:MAG: mechanosensitive ion channel family protein [Sulfolobales archaeon]|nr:mechanosensitive ion channel family protein [Sulfolobales archaeon]
MSSEVSTAREISKAVTRTALYVVLYIVVAAVVQYLFTDLLPSFRIAVAEYSVYAQILLAVAFGYLIVVGISSALYWFMRVRYDHPTAAAVRNVVKIVGIGALAAAIAGGVAGGAAGVALGGFLGIVVGFASQQVLGQAIAGLFLLIARPFKIGDKVVVAGEDGVVDDVSTLFTVVVKADGVRALIPNSAIIGSKIYLKPK